MLRSFFLLLLVSGAASPNQQTSTVQYGSECPAGATASADLVREADALQAARRHDAALHCYARAVERAVAERDSAAEATARLRFALTAYETSNYAEAKEQGGRARTLFEAAGDRASAARSTRLLGSVAWMEGNRGEAERLYQEALEAFTATGNDRERARLLPDLGRVTNDAARAAELREEALALARRIGAADLEGLALHARSDAHFSAGRFDAAIADLMEAIARLEQAGGGSALANAYVSLGRIHRAHGRPADAISYYDRAAAILEKIGDITGLVQSINAKAIALGYLDRRDESRAAYERALELARRTGSQRLINFQQGNLAAALAAAGDRRGAIRLLEDVLTRETDPYILAYRHGGLATHLAAVEEYERAAEHSAKAVAFAKSTRNRDFIPQLLHRQALILRALGRTDPALAAATEAIDAVEQIRARLVPLDFMKRGFGEMSQNVHALTIALLHARGEHARAMEVSERARARAFLDLLVSRQGDGASTTLPGPLARDGADAAVVSQRAATPSTAADIAATAVRIRSTILSYWVSDAETFIWVAAPDGTVRGTRVEITRADLEALVAAALPSPVRSTSRALARAHRLLMQPVRPWLPAGGALTIVPHGPLFRLSFAALRDEAGTYLIERHPITYSPSVSALQVTGQRAASSAPPGSLLLVADPAPLPASAQSLPPLPASRREASAIARVVGRGRVALLAGADARESEVKRRVTNARVVHLATHGVIRDDQPLDSFLALGRTGTGQGEDGRLTVRELYDLSIPADLVVLSACRTATGPLSGDGIAGLSRALFSAGASSVIATLWDVADEPSARLMVGFYRHWRGGMDKRAALRQAQLDLLRDLRSGSVRVRTRTGVIPLQEHPFYWGGYILMGEP